MNMNKPHRKDGYEKIAELFKIMANAKRLEILETIKDKEVTVNEISKVLGILKSNTSQHLALLRYTGIVTANRKGKNIFYSIKDKNVSKLLSSITLNK